MHSIDRLLDEANTILLIDWPGEHCPRTLLRAGYTLFGSEPEGWLRYELRHRQLHKHKLGAEPSHVDLVFCYRPLEELSGYVTTAKKMGARVFWWHSGLAGPGLEYHRGVWQSDAIREKARRAVEEAGLIYIDEVYIGDAVEAADICKPRAAPQE